MKIAFVGEAVSGFGGMETVLKGVISYFQDKEQPDECKMYFFCRNDKMDKTWLKGIQYECSTSNIRLAALRRAKHIFKFSQWLRKNKPDIVICFDTISCLLVNKARKKTAQNFVIFSWPHFSLNHKKHANCIVYADHHLAISSGIKKQMMARGISEQDISLVYNPVSRKNVIINAPTAEEIPTFLYVGRMKMEGQKRIKDLLEGLAGIKQPWKLHVIGDGSDFERCQDYGRKLNINERITWHGWQSDPWMLVQTDIKKVSALLLTSSFEGFPMTLLEAMSFGIPCISSDCESGPADIVKNGINGYLYPPGDVPALTEVAMLFINDSKQFRHETIPSTIECYYDEVYFFKLKDIITRISNKRNYEPDIL